MNFLAKQIKNRARKKRSDTLLSEWMEAENAGKSPEDRILDRIKDKASAPSVGDKVKIKLDGRAHLTPNQKEINGSKGEVKVRTPYSIGSQFARYTVEIYPFETEHGNPQTVHNLNPSEVVLDEE